MSPSPPPRFDPLELLTIREVRAITKLSESSLYRDIHAGRLRTVTLGRSRRIPRVELERYIAAAAERAELERDGGGE